MEQLLHDTRECGATYLQYCMNVCNTIRQSDISTIHFTACSQHVACRILDCCDLSLEKLRQAVTEVETESENVLDANLLLGFEDHLGSLFFEETMGWYYRVSEKRAQLRFGEHTSNFGHVQKGQKLYVDYLCSIGLIWGAPGL